MFQAIRDEYKVLLGSLEINFVPFYNSITISIHVAHNCYEVQNLLRKYTVSICYPNVTSKYAGGLNILIRRR